VSPNVPAAPFRLTAQTELKPLQWNLLVT